MKKVSIVVPDTAELMESLARQRGKIGRTIRFIDQYPEVPEKGAYLQWWNDRWNRWNQIVQPYNLYHTMIERIINAHDECGKILSSCEHFYGAQAKMRLAAFSKENDLSREEILMVASATLRRLDNHALAMLERLKKLKQTITWLDHHFVPGEPRRFYGAVYDTAKYFVGEYFGTHHDHGALLRQIDEYQRGSISAENYDRLDSEYRQFYDGKNALEEIRQTIMDQGVALMPLLHEAVELRSEVDSGFSSFVIMKSRVLVEECDLEPENIDYAPVAAWIDHRNITVMFTTGKKATLPISRYYRLKTFSQGSERACALTPVFVTFPEVNVTIHIEEFLNEFGLPIFPAGSQKDWLIKHEKRRAFQIDQSESDE